MIFFPPSSRTDKIEALPDAKAELIVLDEDFSQFEKAVEAIQKAGLAGKTVVVTAALNVDRMTALLHSGFKDVKLKPYSPAEIPALWEK